MNVNIIDKKFTSVSILEEMYQVGEWLTERPYYVIVDENLQNVGIVTINDFIKCSRGLLIDCNFVKPFIAINTDELDVFEIMKATNNPYLPVFDENQVIGVINIFSIADYLISVNRTVN